MRGIVVSFLVLFSSLGPLHGVRAEGTLDAETDRYRRLHLFFETLDRIQDYYVEDLTTERLIDLAIGGVLEGLDEHSRFLEPEEFDAMRSTTTGRFHGIGVVLAIRGEFPAVISPIDRTPAQRAGVRAGDRLVAINGTSTKGLPLDDVVDLLRGEWRSEVAITIERGEPATPRVFRLLRDEIRVESVVGPLEPAPDIAYIRISRFTETTATEFAEALAQLPPKTAGLVLDLRGNPGGLLGQAVDVADRFVPMGDIVVEVRGRNPSESRTYRSTPTPKVKLPVAVLVDEGSASAAEIVAGAIQDHHAGVVVGQLTFGKGSVQSVFGLEEGNALKLTTAWYYTPSGRNVDRHGAADDRGGIHPDVVVLASEPDSLTEEIVRRGFVTDFVSSSGEGPPDLSACARPDYTLRFRKFLESRGFEQARAANETHLAEVLLEEAALRMSGETGALRVRLPRDPQFRAAVDQLEKGRSQAAMHEPTP